MSMSIRKRLRVIVAAFLQTWHQKQCGECKAQWWVEGRDHHLIAICDGCEIRLLDRMADDLERDYLKRQRYLREVS